MVKLIRISIEIAPKKIMNVIAYKRTSEGVQQEEVGEQYEQFDH
jgi:hypothetical protein